MHGCGELGFIENESLRPSVSIIETELEMRTRPAQRKLRPHWESVRLGSTR